MLYLQHDNFTANYAFNDIVILKLSSPVTLNRQIQIACLPSIQTYTFPLVNESVWLLGWGEAIEDGPFSNQLKNAKVTVYDPLKTRQARAMINFSLIHV